MGTRGVMGVRIDRKDKIGYQQFDSYPSGVGVAVVGDIKKMLSDGGIEKMKGLARALRVVSNRTPPTKVEKIVLKQYADLDVSKQSPDDWYCLLRKNQGMLEQTLLSGYVEDHQDFLLDSLFCEWGYIVNLDKETFEIYKGFQHEPHNLGRYSGRKGKKRNHHHSEYYSCALIKVYPLRDIPGNWVKEVDPEE